MDLVTVVARQGMNWPSRGTFPDMARPLVDLLLRIFSTSATTRGKPSAVGRNRHIREEECIIGKTRMLLFGVYIPDEDDRSRSVLESLVDTNRHDAAIIRKGDT